MNVRLFYSIDQAARAIVILGVVKKEAEGATPVWMKVQMRRRKRLYEQGEYGKVL